MFSIVSLLSSHLYSISGDYAYKIIMSDNLGRSAQKERYVYIYRCVHVHVHVCILHHWFSLSIYRDETVQVLQSYQYDDVSDSFEREPFSVLFRSRESPEDSQSNINCVQVSASWNYWSMLHTFQIHWSSSYLEYTLDQVMCVMNCGPWNRPIRQLPATLTMFMGF